MKQKHNLPNTKTSVLSLAVIMLSIITACTSHIPTMITIQEEEMMVSYVTPYYTGIILDSEIERLNEGDLEAVSIVSEISDLRDLPQAIIYEDMTENLILFECNISYHSGSRIGSYTHYRVCSLDNNSGQDVIAEGVYMASVLPDETWIALIGSQAPFHNCEHQIYLIQVDGTHLYPLIDETIFAHQRFCAINDLIWQVEDDIYQLSFSAWTGSDYPYHHLTFNAKNMTAILTLNDTTSFEYNLSSSD